MKVFTQCLIGVLLFPLFSLGQDTLAYLSFNEKNGPAIREKISGVSYRVITVRPAVEHVPGFVENGLRTDGNSTWLITRLRSINIPLTISGWFALETFPTDTAGFFFISDTVNDTHISACVNQFGKLMIGVKAGTLIKYVAGTGSYSRFKWSKIAMTVDPSGIALYLDGEQVAKFDHQFSSITINRITIGRDWRDKFIAIFPTTAINGIVDEVSIVKGSKGNELSSKERTKQQHHPDLAIPKQRFSEDFNRPLYHLLPAANWTNETHGLLYFNKGYHIFNQKNGNNVYLGLINWGHFSSPDLIHWTEHIPALFPEPGYDEFGIWSGHVVVNNDTPVIAYSCGNAKAYSVGLAYPKDSNLVEWKKYIGNPIVEGQPAGHTRHDLHDPYLWKEGENWYMIIGYGVIENDVKKGSLLLYKSKDLREWKFLHTMFTGNPEKDGSGVFWEMPVFWKMNDKYVLLVNKVPTPQGPAVALYWTGKFQNDKFIPDQEIPRRLEVVNRLLSPAVNVDAEGRTTAIAIIPDETSAEAQYKQGWTHLYSIPRIWRLINDSIYQAPHPALQQLRGEKKSYGEKTTRTDKNLLLSSNTHQVELITEVIPGNAERFGFVLGKNSDGSEQTKIYYDFSKEQFEVDQTKSTKRKFYPLNIRTGKYKIDRNEKIKLHVFVDGSVVEVFINDKDAFTTRFFPGDKSSSQVELFSEGGSILLKNAEVYRLRSAELKSDFKLSANK